MSGARALSLIGGTAAMRAPDTDEDESRKIGISSVWSRSGRTLSGVFSTGDENEKGLLAFGMTEASAVETADVRLDADVFVTL